MSEGQIIRKDKVEHVLLKEDGIFIEGYFELLVRN